MYGLWTLWIQLRPNTQFRDELFLRPVYQARSAGPQVTEHGCTAACIAEAVEVASLAVCEELLWAGVPGVLLINWLDW